MGERMRGRAGQVARARRISMHPLCAECDRRGLVKRTEVIDHIRPLAQGGLDVDENVQGLCLLCHAIKTAEESPSGDAVSNHPTWLRPALGRVVVVAGPPCAGKSTYVEKRAGDGDVVIDLDAILASLVPDFVQFATPVDSPTLNRAIRIRNEMLGTLARPPARNAWLIVSAPTLEERAWWQAQLGAECVLLDADPHVLKARALRRSRVAYASCAAAIDRWHVLARGRWKSKPKTKRARVAFDADGYPLEVSDVE